MQNRREQQTKTLSAYLVAAARAGDQQAISGLVELHGRRLIAHASRLLGEGDGARDCVQEAWIDILRGLKGLRDDRAFLPWALRIVTRRVSRDIKRRQRDRAIGSELAVQSVVSTAEAGPDAACLPAEHRVCVALFYLEDMRVAEVAIALDVPPGTVKTRLMHARDKLRAVLKGENDG
jgi:DNA-directed RNA polymerase specialized sigma24 family protein